MTDSSKKAAVISDDEEEEELDDDKDEDDDEEKEADGDEEEDGDSDEIGGVVKRRKMKRKRNESEHSFKVRVLPLTYRERYKECIYPLKCVIAGFCYTLLADECDVNSLSSVRVCSKPLLTDFTQFFPFPLQLSESEEEAAAAGKKKRVSRQTRKVRDALAAKNGEAKGKKGGGRKRIRERKTSSCEEDKISMDEEEEEEAGKEEEGEGDEEGEGKGKGGKKKRDTRKKMRKIIKDSKLQAETIDAVKAEEERRERVKAKQVAYGHVDNEGSSINQLSPFCYLTSSKS